ncbi:MAG TPA: DNA repair protein RadC [Thermoanaerobaculia bacterium]|jgi:DNA repair protein RadC|nr:DNA repair protein RadC [Thermoanaerobaculia bacterium]
MSIYLIRELPEGERPRERLIEHGGSSLADSELLAVLLRTGRKGVSALQMAMDLLRDNGGLAGLLTATPHSLRRIGIGPAKAAALLAAVEIGRRLAREQLLDREPLSRPVDVARYLALRYHTCDQEVMGALFLDARSHLLGEREIFRGTMSRMAVEPREILRECLQRGASSVYLFHTHPSGDPSPSAEDILFTRRMAEAAEIVGLRLADHIVLGDRGRWVSLKERAKGAW